MWDVTVAGANVMTHPGWSDRNSLACHPASNSTLSGEQHFVSEHRFQQRSAAQHTPQFRRAARHPPALDEPLRRSGDTRPDPSGGGQRVDEAGNQLIHDLRPPGSIRWMWLPWGTGSTTGRSRGKSGSTITTRSSRSDNRAARSPAIPAPQTTAVAESPPTEPSTRVVAVPAPPPSPLRAFRETPLPTCADHRPTRGRAWRTFRRRSRDVAGAQLLSRSDDGVARPSGHTSDSYMSPVRCV